MQKVEGGRLVSFRGPSHLHSLLDNLFEKKSSSHLQFIFHIPHPLEAIPHKLEAN